MVDGKNERDIDMTIFEMQILNTALWDPRKLTNMLNPYRQRHLIGSNTVSDAARRAETKMKMRSLGAFLSHTVKKRKGK